MEALSRSDAHARQFSFPSGSRAGFRFSTDFPADDVRRCGGFSLVELLVVIAVIAIIAAIAIPNVANIAQTADTAKVRRNAQTVAATYNAAVAAGMQTNAASTLEDAVAIVRAGTNIVTGNTSQYYSVDGLSPEESTRAQTHLSFSNGLIVISAQ